MCVPVESGNFPEARDCGGFKQGRWARHAFERPLFKVFKAVLAFFRSHASSQASVAAELAQAMLGHVPGTSRTHGSCHVNLM